MTQLLVGTRVHIARSPTVVRALWGAPGVVESVTADLPWAAEKHGPVVYRIRLDTPFERPPLGPLVSLGGLHRADLETS